MHTFLIRPNSASYTAKDGKEVVSSELQGGASRYRRDVVNSSYRVTAQWTLNRQQFLYFRGFYKAYVQSGSLPFLIPLVIDNSMDVEDYEAHFVADSVRTSQVSGHMHQVECVLEVKQKHDEGYHYSNALAYEIAGDDMFSIDFMADFFNPLHQLVNVKMPSLEVFQDDE